MTAQTLLSDMTVKEAYKKTELCLKKAGCDSPAFDAMCMVEAVFGIDRAGLIIDGGKTAETQKLNELEAMCNRRINFEPLQYIIGKWQFMGLDFFVGDGVLIPRDDTEVVVNCCTDFLKKSDSKNIIDLCSGSGAIAVSLKNLFPHSCVTAVEKADKAFHYLQKNIEHNGGGVTAVQGDIFDCANSFADGEFDLIISNPPYIISDEIDSLQKEIAFEPRLAFDGGSDGFDFYRAITSKWSKKLKQGGMLAFELGENQFETVKAYMQENGFENIKGYYDLGGIIRAINGTLIKK